MLIGAVELLGAQTVTGHVVNEESNAAVEAAVVTLFDLEGHALREAVTAADGVFSLRVPTLGRYRLRARAIGYAATTSPVLQLLQAEQFEVDFRLTPVAVPLPPIEVTGAAVDPRLEHWGYYERQRAYDGFGRFLEGEALRRTATTASDLLRDVPGVRVWGAGGRQVAVRGRFGRRCTFYLDGVKFGGDVDGVVTPSDIVAIEVYPGHVKPIEYPGRNCVVAVWTGIREDP